MREHGCAPEYRTKTVDQDGVMQAEQCSRCGYTPTYGPTGAPPRNAPDLKRYGQIRKG
ncbi:hypothetical protein I5Q34_09485 [Streptomyces sp. AV19]|uniref:hypothetical protein n=1 Tax=Streptomyces sp. AV19 TaxID=2793068 RepID=UPI0018FEF8EF|nr:hypothetical protein [Streptomyces sp. AV19]MBH1934516.1 hypothetical protein [Streptomyces sp. AV19]MDG4533310.1 hypothetical protein [Streptomyces sp. AV19]